MDRNKDNIRVGILSAADLETGFFLILFQQAFPGCFFFLIVFGFCNLVLFPFNGFKCSMFVSNSVAGFKSSQSCLSVL